VDAWYRQHDVSWRDPKDRQSPKCDADEYPPRYLLADSDPEMVNAGQPGGQLMRYLPDAQNRKAGAMWKGVCFAPHIEKLGTSSFKAKFALATNKQKSTKSNIDSTTGEVKVDANPVFKIKEFQVPDDTSGEFAMSENKCWPDKIAAGDPGFALFHWDDWYNGQGNMQIWDFQQPYQPGVNGV